MQSVGATGMLMVVIDLLAGLAIASVLGGVPCEAGMIWGAIPIGFFWLSVLRYARSIQAVFQRQARAKAKLAGMTEKKGENANEASSNIAVSQGSWLVRLSKWYSSSWTRPILSVAQPVSLFALVGLTIATDLTSRLYANTESNATCQASVDILTAFLLAPSPFYALILAGSDREIQVAADSEDIGGLRSKLKKLYIALFMCIFLVAAVYVLEKLQVAQLSSFVFAAFIPFATLLQFLLLINPWMEARRESARAKRVFSESGVGVVAHVMNDERSEAHTKMLQKAKSGEIKSLQAFICSPEGFDALSKHLKAELGLETLLFLVQAMAYSQEFSQFSFGSMLYTESAVPAAVPVQGAAAATISSPKSRRESNGGGSVEGGDQSAQQNIPTKLTSIIPPTLIEPDSNPKKLTQRSKRQSDYEKMLKRCREIHQQFISSRSDMQINLPSRLINRFAGINVEASERRSSVNSMKIRNAQAETRRSSTVNPVVGDKVQSFIASPEIFDDCILEVMSMLYYDSFRTRFLKSPANKLLWEKFLQAEHAAAELAAEAERKKLEEAEAKAKQSKLGQLSRQTSQFFKAITTEL